MAQIFNELKSHPPAPYGCAASGGTGDAPAPKEPLEISRVCHDPDVMQRVYDIGRKAAESAELEFD